MTLTQLKYCLALAKTKHFRKAAEQVFVSQPTLSLAIKKLEEELGTKLFERHKNSVLITELGSLILKVAEDIQLKAQQIKEIAAESNQQIQHIKIGAIYTIGPYLFPSLIQFFRKHYPDIKLSIEENYTFVLTEKLSKGELDFILIADPFEEEGIQTQFLYKEPFIAVLPNNHKLSHQKTLTFKKLNDETILLLGAGHCFRDQILAAYPELNNTNHSSVLQKTLEGTSLETIRYMVAAGNGMTILPCLATQHTQALLKYIPLVEPIPSRNVLFAFRKSFSNKKMVELLTLSIKKLPLSCVEF